MQFLTKLLFCTWTCGKLHRQNSTFIDVVYCVLNRHSANYTWVSCRSTTRQPESLYQRVDRSYDAHAKEQHWSELLPCALQRHRRVLDEQAVLRLSIPLCHWSLVSKVEKLWTVTLSPCLRSWDSVLLNITTFELNVANLSLPHNTTKRNNKKIVCVFFLVLKECRQAWWCFPSGCVPAKPLFFWELYLNLHLAPLLCLNQVNCVKRRWPWAKRTKMMVQKELAMVLL